MQVAGSRNYIVWMAWRSLVSRKGVGLTVMTVFSIAGVTVGVFALVVVLSVMGGFEQDLQRKMLHGEPHLEVTSEQAGAGFSLLEHSLADIKSLVPESVSIAPFTQADVVLKHRRHLQSAVLVGVDPEQKNDLWVFAESMIEGDVKLLNHTHTPLLSLENEVTKRPGIILGEGLAGNLGVDIGDELFIINPYAAVDPSSSLAGGTTTRHFVVAGLFHSGDFNYDNKWAVVSLGEGRKFMPDYDYLLDEEQYVSGIGLNLVDPWLVTRVEKRLSALAGLNTVSWQKSNKSLLFALKLEKFAMGSILMLIVIVAAFSISGTMMMTVFHKRTQVSLLRAVGMTRQDVILLYLLHGLIIGVVGIGIGLALGLGACGLIDIFEFIDLPAGIYYLKKMPVRFIPETYAVVCFCAGLFALVASVYPAVAAARLPPSEGLRYE